MITATPPTAVSPAVTSTLGSDSPPVAASDGRRRLGIEALIYLAGMVLGRLASLIMLPIYTRLLSPEGYGALQILDMTADVAAILVSAGCTAGVMRFYFKTDVAHERRAVLGSAMSLQIGLNFLGTLLLVAFAGPIWQHVLHGTQPKALVYLSAANFTLGALSIVPLILMQIEKRALLFSTVMVARIVLQLSGNIVFLVVLRAGPAGILLSSLIVNSVIGAWTLVWMVRRVGFEVSKNALLDLRRFGLPYQLATLGTFVVTFGDRFFLDSYSGLATVGLYGLAYQFGFMLEQVGIGPFVRAWTPRRFEYAREPRPIRDAKNVQGFRYLNILALTCATGIAVFVRPVLHLMAHEEFWPAADIVPIILAAYIVQGWAGIVEVGVDISERTKFATYSIWASVIASLTFYALLIPRFGGYGAAWATLGGFLVRFAFTWRFSQRLWPVAYGWRPVLRLAAYASLASLTAIVLRPAGIAAELSLGVAIFAVYAALVWLTVLHAGERTELTAFLATRLGRIRQRRAFA